MSDFTIDEIISAIAVAHLPSRFRSARQNEIIKAKQLGKPFMNIYKKDMTEEEWQAVLASYEGLVSVSKLHHAANCVAGRDGTSILLCSSMMFVTRAYASFGYACNMGEQDMIKLVNESFAEGVSLAYAQLNAKKQEGKDGV